MLSNNVDTFAVGKQAWHLADSKRIDASCINPGVIITMACRDALAVVLHHPWQSLWGFVHAVWSWAPVCWLPID